MATDRIQMLNIEQHGIYGYFWGAVHNCNVRGHGISTLHLKSEFMQGKQKAASVCYMSKTQDFFKVKLSKSACPLDWLPDHSPHPLPQCTVSWSGRPVYGVWMYLQWKVDQVSGKSWKDFLMDLNQEPSGYKPCILYPIYMFVSSPERLDKGKEIKCPCWFWRIWKTAPFFVPCSRLTAGAVVSKTKEKLAKRTRSCYTFG